MLRLGGTPPLTRTLVQLMGDEVTIDDRLARRELGYVGAMTREQGLRELAEQSGPDAPGVGSTQRRVQSRGAS